MRIAEVREGAALVVLDADTFGNLVRPQWPAMTRLARALGPPGHWEDVLQDALTTAWRRRSSFDPDRGTLRTWLLLIVADQARKGARGLRIHSELADRAGSAEPADEDVDLARALARLTTRQRTAVALHYYAGLPVADVAVAMKCTDGTVKSTLADARKRLRRELGEDYRNA